MNEDNFRYIWDAESAKNERHAVRQWVLIIILTVALIATNLAWVIYENQFEDITITQDGYAEGNGTNYLNSMGEMTINGEQSETDN